MNILDIYNNIEYVKIFNEINGNINNVTIDTRKVKLNDCYVGIKGDNNDGNLLYMEAFKKGAKVVILDKFEESIEVSKYLKDNDKSIILVKDTVHALGELAKYKRSLFKGTVVAITGSAGKTSTKDMVYSVLKEEYNVTKTIGNHNNHLGLPLTILSLKEDSDILVLEMGMNHLGEISYLSKIARPDIAVITNVGTAHIGNLGSRENILKAKLEILEGLNENGTLIINNDNDLLSKWYIKNKDTYNIKTIGINNVSDYMASNLELNSEGSIFSYNQGIYKVPAPGLHFIYNSLVSIAVADIFNISEGKVKQGIENFELSSNRMNIIKKDKITIIDDSYNANFDSMSYSIKYLSTLEGRNIALLGTMMELGDYSKELHEKIGKIIVDEDIDILITVGDISNYINESAINYGFNKDNSYHFNNNMDAINLVLSIIKDNDNILIKASNSLGFREIVDKLKEEL